MKYKQEMATYLNLILLNFQDKKVVKKFNISLYPVLKL